MSLQCYLSTICLLNPSMFIFAFPLFLFLLLCTFVLRLFHQFYCDLPSTDRNKSLFRFTTPYFLLPLLSFSYLFLFHSPLPHLLFPNHYFFLSSSILFLYNIFFLLFPLANTLLLLSPLFPHILSLILNPPSYFILFSLAYFQKPPLYYLIYSPLLPLSLHLI